MNTQLYDDLCQALERNPDFKLYEGAFGNACGGCALTLLYVDAGHTVIPHPSALCEWLKTRYPGWPSGMIDGFDLTGPLERNPDYMVGYNTGKAFRQHAIEKGRLCKPSFPIPATQSPQPA